MDMTQKLLAARAADSMAFLSDVERKAREACNYEVSDAYQNAWLVIRDLQTALSDTEQRGQERMRERAASLHESINPASDEERGRGDPGAGAMGAVIEYRDKIRALATRTPAEEGPNG